jgi:chromosome segregation ATPase
VGKGSNSDLQNGVNEWWLTITPRLNYYQNNPQLDHKVIDAAAKLWKVAMGRASDTFETDRHRYELQFQKGEEAFKSLEKKLLQAESNLEATHTLLRESQLATQKVTQELDNTQSLQVASKGELAAALATIEGMKEAKSGLETRNADLTEHLSLAKLDASDLRSELRDATQMLSEARQESAIRQRDIASLESQMDQANKVAEEKIRQTGDEVIRASNETKKVLEGIATLQSELAVEKEKTSELEIRNAEFAGKISELSLEVKSTLDELGTQREINATISASLESCKIQLDKSETRLDAVINKD